MIGIILAGGASSRFGGAPKGSARLHGKPMALHVAETLRGLCQTVAIEAAPGVYETLGLPICTSLPEHAGKGPIAGIIAGLLFAERVGADSALFAPCDMPFLTPTLFQRLVTTLDDAYAAYAVTPDGAEPLVALVQTRARPALERALTDEKIERAHVILDRAGAICAWFADPAPFQNINTPEDLEKIAGAKASR